MLKGTTPGITAAQAAALYLPLTGGTVSGDTIFNSNLTCNATVIVPTIAGGGGTAQTLVVESTYGSGATGFIKFRTGLQVDTLTLADSDQSATFGGTAITLASATGKAGIRIPHGAAPTSPVNGDMWTTTAGAFVRINGVTKSINLT